MATVTGTKRHLGITSDTYDSNGDVVVGGNLTINGTTTTLDTANLLVEDKNIIIGNVSTPSDTTADGGGITLKGASDYTINWVNANDRWEFNQGIYSSGPITSAGQITGTEIEGTSLDINGNADISGNLNVGNYVHWDLSAGEYSGDPRAVTMGYSGGNYGQFGYNIEFTTTSGTHNRVFNDIPTRVDLHRGIRVYTSATGTGGTAITWTDVLRAQDNAFQYKGNNIYYVGNDSGILNSNNTDFVSAANGGTFNDSIVIKDSNATTTTTGTTLLELWNANSSDVSQQQSFIDFKFTDTNANYTPQVRIGAQVGPDANADAISKEGAGSFVVYTAPIGSDESGGSTGLAEQFRVSYDGTSTFGGNIVMAANATVDGVDISALPTSFAPVDAEENVRADWTETTTTDDAFILNKPSTFPPSTHNHDDRYYTETEIDENLASLKGWVPAYSNTAGSSVKWDFTEDALKIQSDTDTTTGASFKARRIISGERVRFTIMAKASAASSTGVYFRLYQHNGDMPDGKTHVSNDASNSSVLVQEDDASVTSWHENSAITTDWVTYEKEYTAVADGYISLVILNWTNLSTNSLYIKNPDIQTIKAASANTVTTNANLTGHVTSTGNAAVLGSFTTAELNTAISDGSVLTEEADTLDTVADRGASTNQTITSTNGVGFKVDSSASARIEIENGGTNWAYLRLRDDSTVSWDIASYNGGNLEWRPAGSATNRMTYSSGGVLTIGDGFTSTKGITAYDHSQATHAPTNAEANVQSDWNATSGDALILNKPSIPAASSKGQNNNYIASNLPSSNSTYRDNFGAGVWAYSGYSTGANRPFTYDATLQIMPTANLGFELSTSWHSTGEGSLKIRALRDCCEGWGDYHDVWTSDNFANNSANWNAAYGWGDHASAGYIDSDSNYLKSNASDTFTGQLSVGSTNNRRAGMYGIYDSNRIGHIWSMGTGYMIPSNGSDFGNLYGFAYKHTNNTTGGTMGGGHQAVWATNGTPRASLGESGIWTSGNVTHSGLTMTDGTDIDQIKSYTKSISLSASWQDTGVNGSELATGTYIVQVTVDNHGSNGLQYDEMYSGTMSWYASNTNSTNHDEIILHAGGHARNDVSIFLRVLRTVSANADDLKLQISSNRNSTQTASNYIFKFRRMI